jgi:hypothetical protein
MSMPDFEAASARGMLVNARKIWVMAERGGFDLPTLLLFPASCSFFTENLINKGIIAYFRPVR